MGAPMNFKSRIATIAIITATLFATTGCIFTPMPAHAPTSAPTSTADTSTQEQAAQPVTGEDKYLAEVKTTFVQPELLPMVKDELLAAGYTVCPVIAEGIDRDLAILVISESLGDEGNFKPNAAAVMYDAAATHLC